MVCNTEINISVVNVTQCLKQGNLKGLIVKSLNMKRKLFFPLVVDQICHWQKNIFLVIKDLIQFALSNIKLPHFT